jgi:hypothetical protein
MNNKDNNIIEDNFFTELNDDLFDTSYNKIPNKKFPQCEECDNFENCDDCCGCVSKKIVLEQCEMIKECDAPINVNPDCLGRFLKVNIKLQNVCPGKKILVGVLLCEKTKVKIDDKWVCKEIIKAFKVRKVTIPSSCNCNCNCMDHTVGDFCFILEEPHYSCDGSTDKKSLCDSRTVTVKVITQYTDLNPWLYEYCHLDC